MKKKVLAVLLGTAMVTSAMVCPVMAAESADASVKQFDGLKADKEYEFTCIIKSNDSSYWQAAIQGMEDAADELGVKINATGPNSESDIADQVNMLNTAINAGVDGVALAASDANAVLDSLGDAKEKGVPIVAFDSAVTEAPEGSVKCTVATDSRAAGAIAADHMYEALKDRIANADGLVRIGEVNMNATGTANIERGLGFIDEFAELAKADGKTVGVDGNEYYVNHCADAGDAASADIVIEARVPATATVELCASEAQALLAKDDIIGIFGSNQGATEGIISANNNLNVIGSDAANDVIGVGFDAGATIKAAVSDGALLGAITQSPLVMGYYSVYALVAAANGQEIEDVPTAGYWYDSTNIDADDIAPNLYD